jgi:nucleoside-diphosphate-sugar epimerase
MKIAVIGASGRTGRVVVRDALARGHQGRCRRPHPPKGAYRIDTRPLAKARPVTYGDLATALLDSVTRRDLYRRAEYVAN